MSKQLLCLRGHRWELSDEALSAWADRPPTCPICQAGDVNAVTLGDAPGPLAVPPIFGVTPASQTTDAQERTLPLPAFVVSASGTLACAIGAAGLDQTLAIDASAPAPIASDPTLQVPAPHQADFSAGASLPPPVLLAPGSFPQDVTLALAPGDRPAILRADSRTEPAHSPSAGAGGPAIPGYKILGV